MTMHLPTRRSAAQRGLSIVELLVGMVIALFIAAAGTTLLVGNLQENRSLVGEARLMQDLRTAADVVTRDLRRAGYWGAADAGIWTRSGAAVLTDPYAAVEPAAAASDAVSFRYSLDAAENNRVDGNEQFGFRLRNGAIELQLGEGNWQALTDTGSLTVTAFSVTPILQEASLAGACVKPCPAGDANCPPRQRIRSFDLAIGGRSATDPRVTRELRGSVRLRNDVLTGACPV